MSDWTDENSPPWGKGMSFNDRAELERLRERLNHRRASPWTWALALGTALFLAQSLSYPASAGLEDLRLRVTEHYFPTPPYQPPAETDPTLFPTF